MNQQRNGAHAEPPGLGTELAFVRLQARAAALLRYLKDTPLENDLHVVGLREALEELGEQL